jgi:carboxyl-terminal processing protease
VQRTEESKTYYKEILANKFNFEVSGETLNIDSENIPYSKTKNELVNLWNKQLKYNFRGVINAIDFEVRRRDFTEL